MRVLLFGGTGRIGSAIKAQLRRRGHEVLTVTRTGSSAAPGAVAVDPRDRDAVQGVAAGQDLIISALGGAGTGEPRLVVDVAAPLLHATASTTSGRLLVVGGAGSLRTADGARVVDGADFPPAWRPGSLAQAEALTVYQDDVSSADWVYFSPSHEVLPAEQATGRWKSVPGDRLLFDAHGRSAVSVGDLAEAMVDEAEEPAHHRTRVTVLTLDEDAA